MSLVSESVFRWIESRWRQRESFVVAPIVAAVATLTLSVQFSNGPVPRWGAGLAIVAWVATSIAWLISNRFVPKVKPGRVGILVALTGDNTEQEQRLQKDYIGHLQRLAHEDVARANFEVIAYPPHLAVRLKDKDSALLYGNQSRAHLVIFGGARLWRSKGKEVHYLQFDGCVRHVPIDAEVSKALAADIGTALPGRVIIPRDDDAFKFEIASEWLEIAARYTVACAALISGDVIYAERLLLELEQRLRQLKPPLIPQMHAIAQRVPQRLMATYAAWRLRLAHQHFMTREPALLKAAEEIADKQLARNPHEYGARLLKSMAAFELRNDTIEARSHLASVKRVNDATWRFNLAFLYAYDGDMRNARAEYRMAFTSRVSDLTVPVQCEEFIEIVVRREPDKVQLYYCQGLINVHAKKDPVGAQMVLQRFLAEAGARFPEEQEDAHRLLARLPASAEADEARKT